MDIIKALLDLLPHLLRVEFSIYCAKDVIVNLNGETKTSAVDAIALTEKWLKNPSSVTSAELEAAASSAYSAAYSAYNEERDNKLLQYETYLKEMIKTLSKLEKEIYNLNNIN